MTYTEHSPLTGEPQARREQGVAYLLSGTTVMAEVAVRTHIAETYWWAAVRCSLDPVAVIAQCCHETGVLDSWWSQPPRRNPAGIGCSGVKRSTPPPPGQPHWAQRSATTWLAGRSYPTWTEAVMAHVGLLAVYVKGCSEKGMGRELALSARDGKLPASHVCHDTVTELAHLGHLRNPSGRGWAYGPHSDTYGAGIARHATAIARQ